MKTDTVLTNAISTVMNEPFQSIVGQKEFNMKTKAFLVDRYFKVLSLIRNELPKDVLEIGLNTGHLAFIIKSYFHLRNISALEHPKLVEQYLKSFHKKLRGSVTLKTADLNVDNIPWGDNSFDLVMLSEILEHLVPAHIPQVLSEAHRITKRNGKVVITTPNISSLLKRLNLLRGKNPLSLDFSNNRGVFGHIREYTQHEIIEILEKEFFILRKGYFSIDVRRNMFTKFENFFGMFFHSFSNQFYVVASPRK